MRTQFSRLSSSHISLLRLVERKLQTGFGNELSSETEFTWLPADIAWAFCSDALRRRSNCQYLAFHEAHKGLHGRAFQEKIFIVDMVFLGDTRSAKELAVFTNMAPERLYSECRLRVDESSHPSSLVNWNHYLLRL